MSFWSFTVVKRHERRQSLIVIFPDAVSGFAAELTAFALIGMTRLDEPLSELDIGRCVRFVSVLDSIKSQ